MPVNALSDAVSWLWLPRLSLSGCVRGVMARNTLGVPLDAAQRFNHYPATPLCSISWWFSGSVEMLAPGQPAALETARSAVPARMAFSGPHTRPTVSWSSGPVHGMMLLLQPDALHLMTGIKPECWVNRTVDAGCVLPDAWLKFCEEVFTAGDDLARLHVMESFLEPIWRAVRPKQSLGLHRFRDWAEGLALRAATSTTGRSLRQVERRIRMWAGQPLRELRGIGRAERAFFQAMERDSQERPSWSAIAADTGYSDQSHLCRATRRVTGCTPVELMRRIAEDEGFWPYRIWQ